MVDGTPCENLDSVGVPETASGNHTIEAPLPISAPSVPTVTEAPVVKAKKPRSEKQKAAFETARVARAEAVIRRKQAKEDAAVQSLVDRKGYVLPSATKTSLPPAGIDSHRIRSQLKPPPPMVHPVLSDDDAEDQYPQFYRNNFKIHFV